MRSRLIIATALITVSGNSFAQGVNTKAPFTITLGGEIKHDLYVVNDKQIDGNGRESVMDYHIRLRAEARSENGLSYGFVTRFRNNQEGPNQARQDVVGTDRKYIFLSGPWGMVQLGDTVAPDTEFEVQAPTIGIGQADNGTGISTGLFGFYHANEGEFDTKLVYFTPVLSGFQAGISYTPEKASRGRDSARSEYITGSGNNYRDLVSLGAQYNTSLSAIGVKLGGGIQIGTRKDPSASVISTLGDYQSWHLGAQLSYAGFTFGGHYFNNGETSLSRGDDQAGWQLGLTYVTGPWSIGASYGEQTTDYAAVGTRDATDRAYGIGAAYQLAPGLSLQADAMRFVAESQTTGLKAGATKNEGTKFTLRTRIDF